MGVLQNLSRPFDIVEQRGLMRLGDGFGNPMKRRLLLSVGVGRRAEI